MNIILKACKCLLFLFTINCFASQNFLVISDIHLNNRTKHKMLLAPKINTIRNDLDLTTYSALIKLSKKRINEGLINKPSFILLLGDLQSHKRYKNDVTISESIVFKTISETFTNTPIIYIFGNNDSPQKNYGKFIYNNISPFSIAQNTSAWKNGFLSTGIICSKKKIYPCLKSQNQKNGYFTVKLNSKLKLIGLNSVLFSINNNFKKDAEDEINWLTKQLKLAKQKHEQILIAMHIPPGYNIYNNQEFWRKNEFDRFAQITNKYSGVIIGMLTGHTHQDEIKILTTSSSKIGLYSTPSLSTAYGNSPIIKNFIISKDAKKWHISNYITYKFITQNHLLDLAKIYDFQKIYCDTNTNNINLCLKNANITKRLAF